MLSQKLAQSIVKKMSTILGNNINIMNSRGIIIASGDETRIGDYHEGAAKAVRNKNVVEIKPNDLDSYSGVKSGINLPVYFKSQIVGVVGITGNPEEIRAYGELTRHTIVLMLEESSLREQIHLEERSKEALIHDLISGSWGIDLETVILRGKMVGYDLNLPRAVIILEISNLDESTQKYQVILQKLKKDVLECIKSAFTDRNENIIGFVGSNRIALLKVLDPKKAHDQDYVENTLIDVAEKCRIAVHNGTELELEAGIGRYYNKLIHLKKSYDDSVAALTIGRHIPRIDGIYSINHLQYEYLVDSIPILKGGNYYKTILKQIIALEGKSLHIDLLQTLEALFKHDLNISNAARDLFVHRNTMSYRISKIKEITGLNPTNFYQASQLHLALTLYYLFDNNK